jgi:nicotinate-nucleotide adenylyltransferase
LKIGLYGGTFDPIHNGHLRVVVELISRKIVDRIILIPAGEPQLRSTGPIATPQARLQMCKLAVDDLPFDIKQSVEVSDIEVVRQGPSYAIDTVESFIKSRSGIEKNDLYWIIGSDAYEKIENWHRAGELKELVSFIVIDRPSSGKLKGKSDSNSELDGVDIGALDISATKIRSDQSVSGVSPSVRKYILERKLYAGK